MGRGRLWRNSENFSFAYLRCYQAVARDLSQNRGTYVIEDYGLAKNFIQQRCRLRARIVFSTNIVDRCLAQPLNVVALFATTKVRVGFERLGFGEWPSLNSRKIHRKTLLRHREMDHAGVPRVITEKVEQLSASNDVISLPLIQSRLGDAKEANIVP